MTTINRRAGKRHFDGITEALNIIEAAILRSSEDDIPVGNFDFDVWDVRVRYFG